MIKQSELHRVKTTYGLPAYFNENETEATVRTPIQAFADSEKREYPCHTKSACYLSNVLFWEKALTDSNASTQVGQALLKNATFWGIEDDIRNNILTKVANEIVVNSISDLPDDAFAIVQESADGKTRLYPMLDDETVKLAACQLYEDRNKLPYTWRTQGAKRIMEKVAAADIEFDNDYVIDYIAKASGKGVSTISDLHSALIKRANLLVTIKQRTLSTELVKLASAIKRQKLSKSLCEKTAAMLDAIDTSTGLERWYGSDINTPEEDCHNLLYRDVSQYLSKFVKTSSGNSYTKEALEPVLRDALGMVINKVPDSFEKQCQLLERENISTVSHVERILEAHNIKPVELDFDVSAFI